MEHTIFEPNSVEAHGTRDANAQRDTCSRGTAPQESDDNSPQHGGMPSRKVGQPKKSVAIPPSLPPCGKTHPTALKHLPRTRAKPVPQHRLLTSALPHQPTVYRKNLSNPRARFDHSEDQASQPAPSVADQAPGWTMQSFTLMVVKNFSGR